MRALACALAFAILAAGCTTGDQPLTGAPTTQDPATLWAPAASSHAGSLDLRSGAVRVSPVRADAGSVQLLFEGDLVAFRNATLEGASGWVTFAPGGSLSGLGMAFANVTLLTEAPFVVAQLPLVRLFTEERTSACVFDPEGIECQDATRDGAPAVPSSLRAMVALDHRGLDFPGNGTLVGENATFHARDGTTRPLASGATLGLSGATLHGFTRSHSRFEPIHAKLGRAADFTWDASLRVEATAPQGEVVVGGEAHPLSTGIVTIRLAGGGSSTLSGHGQLSLAGRLVDVTTDETARLGAKLRLAPNTLDASGPAGNVTRVKMVLAETSGGADAHVTGFRVNGTTARYQGAEPFAITNEMLRLMAETEGPLTPAVVLSVGLSLPFVTLIEGFSAFLNTLFPPSIAGPLPAGEARVVTFELQVPTEATDVEILIEAKNAPPVRALVRLTPTN